MKKEQKEKITKLWARKRREREKRERNKNMQNKLTTYPSSIMRTWSRKIRYFVHTEYDLFIKIYPSQLIYSYFLLHVDSHWVQKYHFPRLSSDEWGARTG